MDFTGGVNEAISMKEGGYEADEDKRRELFEVRNSYMYMYIQWVWSVGGATMYTGKGRGPHTWLCLRHPLGTLTTVAEIGSLFLEILSSSSVFHVGSIHTCTFLH